MVVSTLFYLLGDTAVKLASETLPVPQIILIRGAVSTTLVALAAVAAGVLRYWRGMFSRPVLVRGLFDAATTLMFTNALANMRIADATAIINAAPIAGTLLAVFFLKERVDAFRWTAILLGFAGVVLVMQPDTSGFNAFGFLALGAMFTVAGREVVTRRIAPEVPSLIVTLWSTLAVTLAGGATSLTTGAWAPVAYWELGLIAAAAVCLFGAYHYSVVSLRLGEVSLVGPFRYMIILWSLVVGFVVWGDVPGVTELSGMGLIAIAGLVVFRREILRAKREAA
jgi:drug/metabolite transporter (DMT)-like permease